MSFQDDLDQASLNLTRLDAALWAIVSEQVERGHGTVADKWTMQGDDWVSQLHFVYHDGMHREVNISHLTPACGRAA